MADQSTINDYAMIDSFLNDSLQSYRRQVFGNYDSKTGYYPQQRNDGAEVVEQDLSEEVDTFETDPVDDMTMGEDDYYDMMFGDGGYTQQSGYVYEDNPTPSSSKGFKKFATYEEGKKALVNQLNLYKTGKTRNPVKPSSTLLEAMSVYAPSSDNNDPVRYANFIAKQLGITVNTPISKIDTDKWANAIEKMEGNKSGNNPGNLRRQSGGRATIATTPESQFVGLNVDGLDELILPLSGKNTIRGLDNYQPVAVTDGFKYKVLMGPEDTEQFNGTVYEKRLKKGKKLKYQTGGSKKKSIIPRTLRKRTNDNTFTANIQSDNGIRQSFTLPETVYLNNYFQSPKFREKLIAQGEKNPDEIINESVKNVNDLDFKYYSDLDKEDADFARNADGYFQDRTGIQKFFGRRPYMVIPDKNEKGNQRPLIIVHEQSHNANPLRGKEEKEINKRNKYHTEEMMEEYGDEIAHDADPGEVKADLDAFRYFLKTNNITDPYIKNIEQKDLDKYRKEYQQSTKSQHYVDRLLDRFDDSDLLYLLNNITKMKKLNDSNIA